MEKPSVLLVDDDDRFLESLSAVLQEEFHALTSSNVKEALSIITKTPVSLIILDIQMSELSGIDMLVTLRKVNNLTPVFILTGHSCLEWAEKCADLNVQGYVTKPVDVDDLINRIKKVLGMEDFDLLKEIWGEGFDKKMAAITNAIRKALRYVHQNYQEQLTREKISAHLNLSPDYLSRRFHKECGLHLTEYVNAYRIHKSKEHLMDADRNIGDICSSVGFLNKNYFCKLFKEHTGFTPNEFRKKSSKNTSSLISSVP